MPIPSIEAYLPALLHFVEELAADVQAERLTDNATLADKVRAFFTPTMMEYVESVLPGWQTMASYANEQTLIHTMTVFVALLMCPEYQQANAEQRTLMHWIVLLHDLAKVLINGKRDPTHSFRSAALAGKLLARFPFERTDAYEASIAQWSALTAYATTKPTITQDEIQDNRQLPTIVMGIQRMFGDDTPAALIVKAVLLHQSVNVVAQWPQAAPMSDAEIQRYISPALLPLLRIMMLIDNDAWSFFDKPTKDQYRGETLAMFKRIESLQVSNG
jgi:hypothetical protein